MEIGLRKKIIYWYYGFSKMVLSDGLIALKVLRVDVESNVENDGLIF
jgi:hypothetical protein